MQAVKTDKAPAAIGPYSQAIVANGMVFTCGNIPADPATGGIVDGGIAEQTERVIANLRGTLEAAGCGLEGVVKTTVFLKNMGDFAAMNAVYARHFAPDGVVPPARSTVEVARLPKDVLVEIEAIAVLG